MSAVEGNLVAVARVMMYSCRKRGTFYRSELTKPYNDVQGVIICIQSFGIIAAPQGNTTNLYNDDHLKPHHKIQHELQENHINKSKLQDKRLLILTQALYNRLCLSKALYRQQGFFLTCVRYIKIFLFVS